MLSELENRPCPAPIRREKRVPGCHHGAGARRPVWGLRGPPSPSPSEAIGSQTFGKHWAEPRRGDLRAQLELPLQTPVRGQMTRLYGTALL